MNLQARQVALWRRHIASLEEFQASGLPAPDVDVPSRLEEARKRLARRSAPEYLEELRGTIGGDPLHGQMGEITG